MWSKNSWKNYKAKHMPSYKDIDLLDAVEKRLSSKDGIVSVRQINVLKEYLKLVQDGKYFILQGGDCAESFDECSDENTDVHIKLINDMADILQEKMECEILKIGRIAGQFAKPRSSDTEEIDGVEYESYKGDIINGFDKDSRVADPARMETAYNKSANIYKRIFDVSHGDIYTSHEALLLNYDSCLTRDVDGKNYCLSSHMLWIGDRTRFADSAHVEFLSGIENPIGIKVGSSTNIDELCEIIKKLNPDNKDGKIILITRFGAGKCGIFANILQRMQSEKFSLIYLCDPMHGNVFKSESGYKTRSLQDIIKEINEISATHKANNSKLNGLHLEMTGHNVTECIGCDIGDNNLAKTYKTLCDPRLNYDQSIKLVNDIVL
jgi:3-deoxy-7-phosphoheptulonate synthase